MAGRKSNRFKREWKLRALSVERIAIVSSLRVIALMVCVMSISTQLLAQPRRKEHAVEHPTFYRTVQVDGVSIFYREAGPKSAPTILLLHGLPSSSRMFEPLFIRLSDRYHLVAPDYPGFGHSDWPDPKKFAYTFDHYAEIMNHFAEALGLSRYTLYMQDYGGPRSEEHTSELQSPCNLVCRLLLEKKNK